VKTVVINPQGITMQDVIAVARENAKVEISSQSLEAMQKTRSIVEDLANSAEPVYGISTGFGALANTAIAPSDRAQLQKSLIRSHAAGVGPVVETEVTRALMMLRLKTLASGRTGARPILAETMAAILNAGITPIVHEYGSLGCSGDLAPLAHCAMVLMGEGRAFGPDGKEEDVPTLLAKAGITAVELREKEGLALINGTDGMLGMLILALDDLAKLTDYSDLITAMTIEGLLVAGAVRDTIDHARVVAQRELQATIDNPVILPSGEISSNGNFHGAPVGYVLDFLAIAATDLASISERRVDRMMDKNRNNGLNAFLAGDAGVDSGLMIAQYTAAGLVSESKRLANPASVDSIPTSAMQEDHVSMGWHAGRKLRKIIDNLRSVLAIEMISAGRCLDLRAPLKPAKATSELLAKLRKVVPGVGPDRFLAPEIAAATELLR